MAVSPMLLAAHVFCGSVALLAGPVSMLSRKGSKVHRRAGFIFAATMGLGSVLAFALALEVRDRLLLAIAVLTAFLIVSGLRAVRFRRCAPSRATGPGWVDGLSCMLLAGFGIWLLWRSAFPVDATGLFFGAGSLVLVWRQARLLRAARPDWLLAHIAGMGGAYLATANAFLVVNLSSLPKPVIFIVPTIAGTALITWASLRYARRPAAPGVLPVA